MRTLPSILTLAILSFSFGFWAQNASAGQPNDPAQATLSDQDLTPSQLHQMLAEMKQERLDRLRQAGLTIPMKGTAAQSYYDAKYYRLDVN